MVFMNYKDLITLIKEEKQSEQDVFLLSNHNGELLNHLHENLLDLNSFSIDIMKQVNQQLLQLPAENVSYDWITLDPQLFLDRLDSMILYFESERRKKEAMQLKGIAQTVMHLEPNEITIKKDPILLVDNEEALHPDLLKRPIIRRVLSGFLVFREIYRDAIVEHLEKVFKMKNA